MSTNTPNNPNTVNGLVDRLQAMPTPGRNLTFASLGMFLLFMLISAFDTHNEAIAGPAPFAQRILPMLLLLGAFICSVVALFLSNSDGRKNYAQIGLNVLVLLFVAPMMLSRPSQIIALIGLVGCLGALIGLIWLIVAGFRVSVLWGLICLFVPFGFIVFAVVHWSDAKRPFLIACIGFGVLLAMLPLAMMLR